MLEAIHYLRLTLNRFRTEERGVTAVEYAIMLVLVALTVAGFGQGISGSVTGVFSRMISTLSSAT